MSDVTVSKQALIAKIAESCTVAKSFGVREVLDVLPDVVAEFLKEGSSVTLAGIGKLSSEAKEESVRRNPKTGEKVTVPPHNVVKFKINAKLKAELR